MEILLSAILTCSESKWLIDGVKSINLSAEERQEIVEELKRSAPEDCDLSEYGRNWL